MSTGASTPRWKKASTVPSGCWMPYADWARPECAKLNSLLTLGTPGLVCKSGINVRPPSVTFRDLRDGKPLRFEPLDREATRALRVLPYTNPGLPVRTKSPSRVHRSSRPSWHAHQYSRPCSVWSLLFVPGNGIAAGNGVEAADPSEFLPQN